MNVRRGALASQLDYSAPGIPRATTHSRQSNELASLDLLHNTYELGERSRVV